MSRGAKKWLGIVVVITFIAGWAFSKYQTARRQMIAAATHQDDRQSVRTLHLFAMSDYFPAKVLEGFEKKFNAKVQYDNFSNNEELLAKFQAGAQGYDVIVPSDYMVRALIAGGYLTELDHFKIPNLKNVGKDFVDVPFDPGNKYSVPYTWGTTGLVYNSKFVKEPFTSMRQFFDARYKGKISLLDDPREVYGLMLHTLGYSSNSTEPDQLKAAQDLLLKLKPSVRLFSSDPKQHVLSGDIWIAQIYSGDAHQIMRLKSELKYRAPKDGSTVWIDTLAIPKTARNSELAHAFLNYILDPQVGTVLTEELAYASPNTGVEQNIKDDSLKPSYLRRIGLSSVEFLKDLGPAADKIDQLWTEAKSQ